MKKRSSPILLITILLICLGVVFGMNYKAPKAGEHDHDHGPTASEGAEPGAPRTNTPSVEALQKQSSAMTSGMPAQPSPMAKASKMGMPEDAIPPSIENPSAGPMQKPVPNDSNVSTQWYTNEARK